LFALLDGGVAASAAVLAIVTTYALSVPIPTTDDVRLLILPWTVVGVAWGVLLFFEVGDGVARALAIFLAIGAALTVIVSLFAVLFGGLLGLAGWLGLGYGFFAIVVVRARRRRVAWFVAPGAVLVMGSALLTGVPSDLRFAVAEPQLTTFVEAIEEHGSVEPGLSGPVTIATLDVIAVDLAKGCLHLTTGYVGLLDDYPVGLAHCPTEAAAGFGEYELIRGSWYRWYSDSEFPFE
jgi:hypothetical protein